MDVNLGIVMINLLVFPTTNNNCGSAITYHFAIATTGMTVFRIVLVAVPIGIMLRNSFIIRRKTKAS
jgi:hypothetical protein